MKTRRVPAGGDDAALQRPRQGVVLPVGGGAAILRSYAHVGGKGKVALDPPPTPYCRILNQWDERSLVLQKYIYFLSFYPCVQCGMFS